MKNSAKLPKPIAISFCSGDLVHTEFAFSLAMLYGYCIGRGMHACIDSVKSTLLCFGRNMQAHRALGIGASHVLFLDSDMKFPPNTLERLLNRNKDIIGCTYSMRRTPRDYTHRISPTLRSIPMDGRDLFKVRGLGMGCVLIRTDVFNRIPRPWFEVEYSGELEANGLDAHTSEDVTFFERAIAAGFNVWCDWELSQEVKHVGTFEYGLEHVEMMPTYITE